MIWNPWKKIRELELKIRNLSGEIIIKTDYINQILQKNEKLTNKNNQLTEKVYKQKQELKNNKIKWS